MVFCRSSSISRTSSILALALAINIVSVAMARSPATGSADGGSAIVTIDSGKLAGRHDNGIISYKGVPFAAPPIGMLRWQAPQPVQPWTGIRDAKDYQSDCATVPDTNPIIGPRVPKSEDCLYLNIWKPESPKRKLPVLVWIYGGGFTNGGTSPIIYDGANLAKQGVIVVSINYRLGQLGFFAHPALAKEQVGQPRGNYGFLDQIAAFKWIKQNIAAFGGDPENVTAFGESAGGFSVHMLLTSPLAKGLINKAIIQSGGGRRTIMYGQRMSDDGTGKRRSAESSGMKWAQSLGIDGTGPDALAKLRSLPTAEVLKDMSFLNPLYAGPMIDGDIVPYNMMTAYQAGNFAHVPVMIGTNSGDMSLSRAQTKQELFAAFGADEAPAKNIYDPAGDADFKTVRAYVGADEMMHETARFTARQFSKSRIPAYIYRFDYVAAVNKQDASADAALSNVRDTSSYGGVIGALHTTEIPFVFNNVTARYRDATSEKDREIAQLMSAYWVSFAKTGNPNAKGLPTWQRYSKSPDQLLIVNDDGAAMKPDPWKARLDIVEKLNAKIAE